MRNFSIKNTVWKNPGNELDSLAKFILDESKKIVLLGKASNIKAFKERNREILVDVCINTDDGIIHDEMLMEQTDEYIYVCVSYERNEYNAIRDMLVAHNVKIIENKNFFQGEIFQSIWYVYKKNEIRIDRVEIFLTSSCTLNCEKCIAFVPYFQKNIKTSLDMLKKDADLFFSKIDFVYKLKLLGGEGFLYPDLVEYIDYLYNNYGNKIGNIRIGTNGTIHPNRKIIECCRRHDVIVDISDYTGAVPEMCKLDEVIEVLKRENIKYDIKRVGEHWLDLGFPTNIPEEKKEEELREHFSRCAMFCRDFYDGKLYFCCANFAAVKSGMFQKSENDYFDFRRDFDKKELLEYEIGYSKLGHTTFCKVCNGCSDDVNSLYVPVAKQMQEVGER